MTSNIRTSFVSITTLGFLSLLMVDVSAVLPLPPRPQNKIFARDAATYSFFGTSLAKAGNLLAVSAPADDLHSSVYLFESNPEHTIWAQKDKANNPQLKFPVPHVNQFGKTITMNENFLFVGATSERAPSNPTAGAVYAYDLKKPLGGKPTQKLTAFEEDDGSFFGSCMQASGSLLIIGTLANVGSTSAKASIFKFNVELGLWQEDSKFVLKDNAIDCAVAIDVTSETDDSEDPESPGAPIGITEARAVVGSAGLVYLFVRKPNGVWEEEFVLDGTKLGVNKFGSAVAISEDTIMVSAETTDGKGVVFSYHIYNLNTRLFVKLVDTLQSDDSQTFGKSISFKDGLALVAAPAAYDVETSELVTPGYVFTYSRSTELSKWTQIQNITDDSVSTSDFASNVLLINDNANYSYAVIGAPFASGAPNVENDGAVYFNPINKNVNYSTGYSSNDYDINDFEQIPFFSAKSFGIFVGLLCAVIVPSATIAAFIISRHRAETSTTLPNKYENVEKVQESLAHDDVELDAIAHINPIHSH